MAIVYKLISDEQEKEDYDKIDYQLIAIHTSLEDYRLAFFINKCLPIILSKCNSNVSVKKKMDEIQFSRFIFDDEKKDITWNLIQNKNEFSTTNFTANTGLFENTTTQMATKTYLIPEYKKVDYFLKIENCTEQSTIQNAITEIKKIEQISTVYAVATETIKSKNNLIF
jgi:hypothetical protein